MTTEDKELLLNDLCARLPYGMRFEHKYGFDTLHTIDCYDMDDIEINSMEEDTYSLEEIKPILIPLKDVDETLQTEFCTLFDEEFDTILGIKLNDTWDKVMDEFEEKEHWLKIKNLELKSFYKILRWCYKHHIDVNGLIDKGLAVTKKENTMTEEE
jgi:hypothetical protein